ncbi:Spo0B domain-containing protein [Paenibacillus sp. IB182496]|uniref:histidine kinase n=1 Tax=Paenibacillus sabuli TaxID=2772509 RepID=A0A927GUE2_9BACL|nr:ATP-binding protein [Paenibacillus sabuli]MBD2848266.1 Spo0B domain-containing protein [Paenibacillus sabuli]
MDYIMQSLTVLVFLSIPQTFIHLWFVLVFWGFPIPRALPRLLAFAVVYALYVDLAFLALPTPLHILNSALAFLALSYVFFLRAGLRDRLMVLVSMFTLTVIVDLLAASVISHFADPYRIRSGPASDMMYVWPFIAAVGLLAYWMHTRGRSPGIRIRRYILESRNRLLHVFLLSVFVQVVLAAIYVATQLTQQFDTLFTVLFLLGIATMVAISYLSLRLISQTRSEAIRATQNRYVGDLMQVLTSLRGQRHDFANHLQVMSAMVTMGKHEQLKRYIDEVADDLQSGTTKELLWPSSAVSALIQAKAASAAERRIEFQYEDIELSPAWQSIRNIDLVRIIANLLDNAFDETVKLPEHERRVSLRLRAEDGHLLLEVTNNCEWLTDERRRMMFTPGYTTKGGPHSGLGLAIVRDLTDGYGGRVEVRERGRGRIQFAVTLPLHAHRRYG